MVVGLCANAKKENAYINEWVGHHIGLGFDHIWLYDNNDEGYPYVGDFIDKEYRDKVTIIKYDYEFTEDKLNTVPSNGAYSDFLERYRGDVDWCAFIDIDEFVILDGFDSVKSYLEKAPQECDCVCLYWRMYGDDGVIEGDESEPVLERFRICIDERLISEGLGYPYGYKTMIRCDKPLSYSQHIFYHNGEELTNYDSRFKLMDNVLESKNNGVCWINHYMTKTLSEFLKYWNIGGIGGWGITDPIEYFFRINERTDGKERYIREHFIY